MCFGHREIVHLEHKIVKPIRKKDMNRRVMLGIEHLAEGPWKKLRGLRVGLLCNQASVDSRLRSTKHIISSLFSSRLKALFTPQHGYGAEEQDNMRESPHGQDEDLGIPVFSLYAETREPSREMLDLIDVLIVDLQDVGCRVYTFASTMLNCMEAASRHGRKIVILDRPNPLGGEIVEGNLLKRDLFSFVGPYSVPMRHGLTMGEMALMFNDAFGLACDLEVIPMKGWTRNMSWTDTHLPWLMPSPNMPLPQTAYVYPGQVIWEGTNLSEGRGTCRPFEIFGAPFLVPRTVMDHIPLSAVKGCMSAEFRFTPTFNKWCGQRCNGFFIHVTSIHQYRPYRTSLLFLQAILQCYRDELEWKGPPYEYVFDRRPIDLIIGDTQVVKRLQEGIDVLSLEKTWEEDLKAYLDFRKPYLLY